MTRTFAEQKTPLSNLAHPIKKVTPLTRAINLQLCIHHTALRQGQHRTCAARVELGAHCRSQPRLDVRVALHGGTGGDLGAEGAAERGCSGDLACELDALAQDSDIFTGGKFQNRGEEKARKKLTSGMRKILRIDDGLVIYRGRIDVYPSVTSRGNLLEHRTFISRHD
jgi:hypothetical protein